MSNKTLAILAAVAAVMVGIAALQSRLSQHSSQDASGPKYLIQGLNPDDIVSIEIANGDEKTTLSRDAKGFVVVDKGNYQANAEQINELITGCLDIKTNQLYARTASNHADLEVTEDKAKDVVKFLKKDATLLTGVIVGKYKEEGQGTYIRLVDSNDVYVTERAPYIRKDPMDYLNKDILAVTDADILTIRVTDPNGGYVLDANDGPDDIAYENLPAGKTLKNSEAKSVLGALSSFSISDVKKGSGKDLSFDRTFVCELKSGVIYTLKLAKAAEGEDTFMTCASHYVGEKVTIDRTKKDSEEELKAKEAKLLAQTESNDFTEKHKGWLYSIPQWKATALLKSQTDLLEDIPEAPTLEIPDVSAVVPTVTPGPGPAEPNQ
jgi:hypothetical protein